MISNRGLLHELWEWQENGVTLSSFIIAGPHGAEARARLPADAKLAWTAWAVSHCEAMTLLHDRIGPEPHTSDSTSDFEPYPEDMIEAQRSFLERQIQSQTAPGG